MTERTIRYTAKEIAGQYFDQVRSERFRKANFGPGAQQRFVNRYWPHFIDLAIQSMVHLLRQPNYPTHLKEAIAKALIEQNEKVARAPHQALLVPQATGDPVEKEDRRLIDDNPQLVKSETV